jgi:hypothetical protein
MCIPLLLVDYELSNFLHGIPQRLPQAEGNIRVPVFGELGIFESGDHAGEFVPGNEAIHDKLKAL